ncbi:acylneuraminate cytidylyltransferase [Marivirga salinae]|uniref:N-acylneuraminate cytidylyltransferase n=1 Tax=Marivirga salinarum TaxID=3059078 RepID=A0AA51N8W7_9BACT|nr:acylneuraminate cytidylyltransferase [Marivirga sp. BDSF4-3]WMN10753.1 acylneuraminate cytidylyltransferase [Marivirga sp. BDSF4-3]
MKKIAFIPVRGGSKSIPLKNIKLLNGKPLVYYVTKALQESLLVDEVVIATDSEEIESVVNSFEFSKVNVYSRKKENAADQSSTESVMLEYIKEATLKNNDIFILVQATSPFTSSTNFDEALKLYEKGDFDSLLTCARIKRFFWDENGQPINYDYTNRPRRQDFEGNLIENGAFYINSVGNIIKNKNRLSGKIGIYEMPEYTQLELDEPWDWQIAEELILKYGNISQKDKSPIKLVLSDVDGVLTDAGMYYSENGDELKKFSTYDGKGFELLRNNGIKTGIMTAEDVSLNRKRAQKLKVDFQFHGIKDKISQLQSIIQETDIKAEEIAYIGDDINDEEVLKAVGLAACPANSVSKIKAIPNIIKLQKSGGNGAFREFVDEHILKQFI